LGINKGQILLNYRGDSMDNLKRLPFKTLYTLGILLSLLLSNIWAQNIIPHLQRDDHEKIRSWWWYHNESFSPGSETQLLPQANNGYLLYMLKDPEIDASDGHSWLSDGSNVSIETQGANELYPAYENVFLRQRVKMETNHRSGSRGWGFWFNEYPSVVQAEVAWFMQLADEGGNPNDTWWRSTVSNGRISSNTISTDLSSDYLTGWHVYDIHRWGNDLIEMYIDGNLVLSTNSNLPDLPYEYNQWVDNVIYHTYDAGGGEFGFEYYFRAWTGENIMLTDYVEIIYGYSPIGYSVAPTGIIKLREYPNEIAFGYSNYEWKDYSFDSDGGHNIIIVTAKAEEYDGYDNPDQMKIVLNSTDYGYTGVNGWHGDELEAIPKTVVIDEVLTAGTHDLKIYSSITPILYDVTVLNSLYGAIMVNQDVSDTAPASSNNYEWQTFNFQLTNAGEIGIYVSAIADENPGWAHHESSVDDNEDDDLRAALYQGTTLITDYGWQTDQSWYGNELFGEIKSILFHESLSAGTYTLKLYANNTPTLERVLVYGEFEDSSLPVELSTFNVVNFDAGNILKWSTSSELENLGFNIYRAESKHEVQPPVESFMKINADIILGAGNSSQSHYYQFIDAKVQSNLNYWYYLEDVAFDGGINRSEVKHIYTSNLVANSYHLYQNYPNPFNPETKITFSLADVSETSLIIYDMHGNTIRTLINKKKNKGIHSITWDGTDQHSKRVSTGLYYYRLTTPKYTKSQKMLYIK